MKNLIPVQGIEPKIGQNSFIAPSAQIIGKVKTGKNCSFWFNSITRGDVNTIDIGDNVNIQDGAVIHCTYKTAKTFIGNNVSIGHNAIVHGCTVKDNVLIGMGAIVMDHAVIGEGSIIAAGAIVLENTEVPPGSIFGGIPAKFLKKADENNLKMIQRTPKNYLLYSSWFDPSIDPEAD